MQKKNILLINPFYELEIRWIVDPEELVKIKADQTPLGLATVAGLTPEDEFQVDIWDELIRGPINEETRFERQYDLVGITSCRAHIPRSQALARIFRKRGIPVVIGGPGVSGTPDRCRQGFDVLFIGEAEITWPQFLRDWQAGQYRAEYRQIEKVDLAITPPPRWDSLIPYFDQYAMGAVQTTRGCPFDCEFCDVVYLFGRRQRHKPIERVLAEIHILERHGITNIFFSDDNFIGNLKYCKDLLRQLIPLNNSFATPIRFNTQASMEVARDEELLELLADANFVHLVLGIETPNKESLKETGKFQNLKGDLVEEVHKVLSYGLIARGAIIVGFDHDGPDIFDIQYDYIQKACLPAFSLHMLNAPIGTRLWRRLREEGRVLDITKITDKITNRIFSNITPKRLTRVQLMQGFGELYARLFTWESFKERMFGFIALVQKAPKVKFAPLSLQELLKLGPSLNLDAEACKTMEEIFTYAAEKVPFLLRRVKELVVQFIRYKDSAYSLLPKLEQQIKLEASGELTFEEDIRPLTIPAGFRKAYKSIFTDIYRRTYLNLKDKDKTPEALMEIFVDFLVHEEGFQTLEDFHIPILKELCDKVCAKFNGVKPEEFVPIEGADLEIPDALHKRLNDDVLKSVEQELIKLVQTRAAA